MENEPLKEVSLELVARTILGHYYEGVEKFFDDYLLETSEETYTLFITRRCSCLAYIFKRIIENRKGVKIDNNKNHLLTNSSFINAAKALSNQIMIGKYPKIRMIDDSISYGRAITNILDLFSRELKEALLDRVAEPDLVTEAYISKYVTVHVFMKKDQYNLFSPLHNKITDAKLTEPQHIWNDFSTRASELISNSDVANAAFVFSAAIDQIPKVKNNRWKKVQSKYHKHQQTAFFYAFPNEKRYKAVCSIRCFPCSVNSKYRIIPFLFLPDLSDEQIDQIERVIFRKINVFSTKDEDGKLLEPFEHKLKMYQKRCWLRLRAEFVTMYLSHALLLSFVENDCEIKIDLNNYDYEKINWTYSFFEEEFTCLNNFFNEDTLNDKRLWLSSDDISDLISEVLEDSPGLQDDRNERLCHLIPFHVIKDNTDTRLLSIKEERYRNSHSNVDLLTELCEVLLFERAIEAEKQAHDLAEDQYSLSDWQRFKSDPDRRYRVGEFERDLWKDIRKNSSIIQFDALGFTDLLAVTLQIMDAGLMSIVTRDIADDVFNKTGSYHVIEQQVRICEQALCVFPRHYYRHMKVLGEFYREENGDKADITMFNILLQYHIIPRLQKYIEEIPLEKNEKNRETLLNHLIFFLMQFKIAEQKMDYWDESVTRRFAVKTLDDEPKNQSIPKGIKLISGKL